MTDPRLLECAKAAESAFGDFYRVLDDGQAEHIARAVILKWLEQGASPGMIAAGYDGDPLSCDVDDADAIYRPTYAAMCAQARKEISEP